MTGISQAASAIQGVPPPVRPNRGQMLVYYAACGFPISFLSMVMFLLPLRARELGAPVELIGIIIGAGSLLGMIAAVPAGALADRIGARQSFLLGAVLDGLAAIAFWMTDSYWMMLGIQFLRGIPHSMAWVASQTYVAIIGGPEERAALTSRFSFATGVSGLISPILVGSVAELVGYRSAFFFLAFFCVAHVAMALLIPDVRSQRARAGGSGGSAAGYGVALGLLRLRGPQVAVLLTFIRLWVGTGWSSFFPIFLVERGFSPLLIGTVLSGNGLVSAVTGLGAHWLARRTTHEIGTAAALALAALGMALSPHLAFVPVVYLPTLLLGTGSGVSMPLVLAILGNEVPAHQRGVAMGLRTSANQGGLMVAPVAMGFMVGGLGVPLGFLCGAIFCWAMLGLSLWMHLTARGDPGRAGAVEPSSEAGTRER